MDKGLIRDNQSFKKGDDISYNNDFVLEKTIFSKIFGKDIRRVYVYKKAERIAKALLLVSPAFRTSYSLKDKIERIAVALIEVSTLPPEEGRGPLSRELLSLQGVLQLAKTSGSISSMNADIILREALNLLQEIALYETPAVSLGDSPSLSALSRSAIKSDKNERAASLPHALQQEDKESKEEHKGQRKNSIIKDNRKDEILSVLRTKGPSFIKDISTMIKGISEKTVQRELNYLVSTGIVVKSGKRRWTKYELLSTEKGVKNT